MAKAVFRQDGNALDYTAKTAVAAGEIVVIGDRIGVAGGDIDAGATGAVVVEGVFTMPKKAATAIEAGKEVYFSAADGTVSTTSADTDAGYAVESAAADAATVRVKLRG